MRFNNIDIHSSNDSGLTELMRKESSHIIDMYFRLLKFYDNGNCKKLNISCHEKALRFCIISDRNGYITLQAPFCQNRFLSLSPKEKSCFYLNLIHRSVIFIGTQWGWNLEYFDFIRRQIISSNFKNQWIHGKPSLSPLPNKIAYLRTVQTINEASIFLIVTQNLQTIRKIPVAVTEPTFWTYRQYLGKICWINDSQLQVVGKEGQIIFEASGL